MRKRAVATISSRQILNCIGLCAIAALAHAQPPPGASEQIRIVAAIREEALGFNRNLPNFVCTQLTRRHIDYTGVGDRFEQTDQFEQQLTYFDRHENYKLISVNGWSPDPGPLRTGVTSSGEFGSILAQLFDPASRATFSWSQWDTLRSRPVYVFSARVAKSRSKAVISDGNRRIVVGYHGRVYADRETKSVLRLVIDAETPKDFPLQNVAHVLDYGLAVIAGSEFLLPLRAELRSRVPDPMLRDGKSRLHGRTVLIWNETDFLLYRKYAADAAITFGQDDKGKKDKN